MWLRELMNRNILNSLGRRRWVCPLSSFFISWAVALQANPVGGTVTHGTATFTSQGSQFTIRASDGTLINWQSFNIGLGQTTTFIQPSASSVVWNQINDPNPSQILGTLNANGYVVLQNSSGFFIGGQAAITTHGLLLTTAPIPTPDLWTGSAWDFKAPPPAASIVNYGQINTDRGGSVFVIAQNIENHGTISTPEGSIGLYAGKEVLLSERPDGRGLSARVTLPEGSVDNSGKLIADAGSIALQAQVVNQGGLIQANSVRDVNGTIELVAGDAVNLGADSQIVASGDTQGISRGGSVIIRSDKTFTDESGSTINIAGGTEGGNGGQVEISASQMSAIHSAINGKAAPGFIDGELTIDPENILLASSGTAAPGSGSLGASDPPIAGTLTLDVTSFARTLSQINLEAANNIELSTLWTLADAVGPANLSLSAGNNITFDNNSGILAGKNWSVSLSAGPQNLSSRPTAGRAGIYLNGNSFLQTQDGGINLWAANEVIINPGPDYALGTGEVGNNGIRTSGGGNINVTAEFGDVNTGGNFSGYLFGLRAAPFYRVNAANLGGISTAAGGNVTISAGGSITSYLPIQNDYNDAQYDGGTGAFGPEPGNVTINAGGNVTGHYVLANGVGSITAQGNIGSPVTAGGFALSLIKGSWSILAPKGDIYVQDVRNPNGVFNDKGGSVAAYQGYHFFDYDPNAALSLQAGGSIEVTGAGAPHGILSSPGSVVPFLFPPSLEVVSGLTGRGNFILDTDVILFPSSGGNLNITTLHGGNFQSYEDPADPQDVTVHSLEMSDSSAHQWDPSPPPSTFGSFLQTDHAASPPELNNPNPVEVFVSGSMDNVNLRTTKATQITVGGDMFNAGFLGENLHPSDVSFINVAGSISYSPIYSFTHVGQSITGADPLNPSAWDSIFSVLVDPRLTAAFQVPPNATVADLNAYANALRLVLRDGYTLNPGVRYDPNANPGFIYDPATGQLGFQYRMSQTVRSALEGPLESIKLDQFGNPVIQLGNPSLGQDPTRYYFATTQVSFVSPALIEHLYNQSLSAVPDANHLSPGLQIGGPGQFNLQAASMDLGSSGGIISWGIGSANNPVNYSSLASETAAGAAINIKVSGDIAMLTSTIASIDGGDVTVNAGGGLFLSLGDFALIPPNPAAICYGIFTSGHSDVHVTANQDINIGGARIAAFNGGDVFVTSLTGDVNAGNGANSTLVVPVIYLDPATHQFVSGTISDPKPFGSGILAMSPTEQWQTPGGSLLPGNITVDTPRGDIISTLGGIQQLALNGSIAGGPTITLNAGTPASGTSSGYMGNVDLGAGGVVGGTINITAQGSISGLIVSHQNSTINAAQSFSGTLLAGGTANVSATGGSISGTVIGIGGVNASSGAGVTAALLGQNVSVGGGPAQSTLGTAAGATSTSQAAAQQANSDSQQQLTKGNAEEDDAKKKKKASSPTLVRRVGRVTVILPPNS